MNGLQAYALSKDFAASALLGIGSMSVEGTTVHFTTTDGKAAAVTLPQPQDGVSIVKAEMNAANHMIITLSNGTTQDAGVVQMPTAIKGDPGKSGKDGVDGASAYDIAVKNGFQGNEQAWLASLKGEDGTGAGGDATLEEDVQIAGVTVGNLKDGATLTKGMSVTDVLKMMLQKRIAASYTKPTLSLSSSQNKIFEKGTSYKVTITPAFAQNDGGEVTTRTWTGIGDNLVAADLSARTFTITDTTTAKLEVKYGDGAVKKDNFGDPSPSGQIKAGSVIASIAFTAASPFYHGTGAFNASTAAKDVSIKGKKIYTYSTVDDTCYIAYPTSYGNLKSIIDQNNFDVTNTFTKTTTTVNGVGYNVYTNGASTITGFKFTFNF